MTHELAPTHSLGPTYRSYWVVEGRLAAGGYPGQHGHEMVGELLDAGIDLFVNLTQDHPGGTDSHMPRYDDEVEAAAADVRRFPIPDLGLPTHDLMVEILDTIDAGLDAGRRIYVHCWGGSGRTGTAIGCWLRRHRLTTPGDVIKSMNRLRDGDLGGGHKPTPNTPEQAEFIVNWREEPPADPST